MYITENELTFLNEPRYPGSLGEAKALSYILDCISAEKADSHIFSSVVKYRTPSESAVRIDNLIFEAKPYVFLQCTDNTFYKGKFHYIPRLSDLDQLGYENGIILIHDPLTIPTIRRIESSGVSAVITCGDLFLTDTLNQQRILCHTKTIENAASDRFAGVNVNGNIAREILNSSPDYIEVLNNYRTSTHECKSIICDLRGESDSEIVILCAHYDTVFESPGALDNLSGMLILLKILSILKHQRLSRKVRLCWFGAEEQQAECSECYVLEQIGRENGKTCPILVVNVDSADAVFGCDQLYYSERDLNVVKRLNLSQDNLRLVQGEYGGDDLSFIKRGIPTVTFTKAGALCDALHHCEWDTIPNAGISDESLSRQAKRIVSLIAPFIFF